MSALCSQMCQLSVGVCHSRHPHGGKVEEKNIRALSREDKDQENISFQVTRFEEASAEETITSE